MRKNMHGFSTVVKDFCCVSTKLWDPPRSRRDALMRGLMRGLMREQKNASSNERKRNEPGVDAHADHVISPASSQPVSSGVGPEQRSLTMEKV